MWYSKDWKDYELLDASDGERLERWGKYILVRPDPQIIWRGERSHTLWDNADGIYRRSSSGGGAWIKSDMPEEWKISYGELNFNLKPMGFKHTGLFPEQAVNWDWFSALIKGSGRKIRVLNLFAYTGGATVAAAGAGAEVVHVDASKGMVAMAKENAALSGLSEAPIRYIVDDCKKFVEREIRRGNKYDGIIMDPPSYGRGPSGEVWQLEESIDEFVGLAARLLSDEPLFFLVNSYTTGLSPNTMKYVLDLHVTSRFGGISRSAEIGLPVTQSGGVLPCGASSRWQSEASHKFEAEGSTCKDEPLPSAKGVGDRRQGQADSISKSNGVLDGRADTHGKKTYNGYGRNGDRGGNGTHHGKKPASGSSYGGGRSKQSRAYGEKKGRDR